MYFKFLSGAVISCIWRIYPGICTCPTEVGLASSMDWKLILRRTQIVLWNKHLQYHLQSGIFKTQKLQRKRRRIISVVQSDIQVTSRDNYYREIDIYRYVLWPMERNTMRLRITKHFDAHMVYDCRNLKITNKWRTNLFLWLGFCMQNTNHRTVFD